MRFTIPADHPSLPGHFPGNPVVPGVVVLDRVIEAIEARTGGPLGALRLPQVKFLRPLLPAQEAHIELDGQAPRWRFRVLHDTVLLASGDVMSGDVMSGDVMRGDVASGEVGSGEVASSDAGAAP